LYVKNAVPFDDTASHKSAVSERTQRQTKTPYYLPAAVGPFQSKLKIDRRFNDACFRHPT
jgi:hypothetical protein